MTELGHLWVADRLWERLGWAEAQRPYLYLGAIAPDAYRVAYSIPQRLSHFRYASPKGLSFNDFVNVYLRPAMAGDNGAAQAFFSGWLSHLCADRIWRQKVRYELAGLWERIMEGPAEVAAALKQQFFEECAWADLELYRKDSARYEEILAQLSQAEVCFRVPPLQAGDIFRWREIVVQEKVPPLNVRIAAPQWLSMEFVLQALQEAEEESLKLLLWEQKLAQEHKEGQALV